MKNILSISFNSNNNCFNSNNIFSNNEWPDL